jgi:putative ABC transport system permease protein
MPVSVAWHNALQNKRRTVTAVSGIAFSILLIFMQIGFLEGAKTAAASLFHCFDYDLGIVSDKYRFMGAPGSFDRMRLTQAAVVPEVEDAMTLCAESGRWKNPDTEIESELIIFGITLKKPFIRDPDMRAGLDRLHRKNTLMVDRYSHRSYGPLSIGREVEVNNKDVTITSQFTLGVTLFSDGCIVVGNDNFSRLTSLPPREVNYGFLKIIPGSDPLAVKNRLEEILPDDVLVFTREAMIRQDQDYFIAVKPVGIIFQFGVVVSFMVGVVILFQVLNTDISTRLNEFATLKAMGFKSFSIYGIGVKQALLYALLSYFPALAFAAAVFRVVHGLSKLPMDLTPAMAGFVFAMSLLMCVISCVLGLQKVRRTDPAELF